MQTVVCKCKPIIFLIALAILVVGRSIIAQNQLVLQPQFSFSQDNKNLDNWRLTPTKASAHPDTLSPEARQARDAFWTKVVAPLPPPGGLYSGEPVAGMGNNYGELYAGSDALWVVGTFASFDVHETRSGSIYTEIHFYINQNVSPIRTGTPLVGDTVDIGIPGGSLVADDGSVRELRVAKYKDYVRPGHRYLLRLEKASISEPDFYHQGGGWDLTSGIARATFPREGAIDKNGKSSIVGLSEVEAIRRVEQILSANGGK